MWPLCRGQLLDPSPPCLEGSPGVTDPSQMGTSPNPLPKCHRPWLGLWGCTSGWGCPEEPMLLLRPQAPRAAWPHPCPRREASASGRGLLGSWYPQRRWRWQKAQAAGLRPQGGHGPHQPGPCGRGPRPRSCHNIGGPCSGKQAGPSHPPVHGSGEAACGCAGRWAPVPLSSERKLKGRGSSRVSWGP